ncbi:MAG: glycine dehydrogenase (aminomethyl-transferring), partial [Flavobacteriaceae bacterium]|nr:glycine dehydrogenase (aminomethyl-transferring) [Flavobacteriaceae bacterium]
MNTESFLIRHIGPRDEDIKKMLKVIKAKSLDELIDQTLPNDIKLKENIKLDKPLSESEYLTHLKKISALNKVFKSYIGLGYNRSYLPAVIQRNILENPGWYTAYTPYQAEISQGRMEALLNFQTMITDLTGMEISNASLLDESTAAAEAMTLLYAIRDRDQKKNNVSRFFVSKDVFPQTLSVLNTRSKPIGIELVVGNIEDFKFDSTFFGALIQYPGASGEIKNIDSFISKCISNNIKTAVAADILSLVLLESPGKLGADVVVGTTQRFGIPLGYGGPHAGYFATKEAYKRNIPGRIIGVSIDCDGDKALRMALQTREQHIKRDRATSNICTAQVLLAVMAGMYAVYHGPEGLREIANKVHHTTRALSKNLESFGLKQLNSSFFDTIRIEANRDQIKKEAEKKEINFHYPSEDIVSITINETTTIDDLNDIISVFSIITDKPFTKLDKIEENIDNK